MGMMKDFKEFAVKGSLVDMAVGIIMGAALGKIVNSLVADVIMPVVGKLMGGVDFSQMFINLTDSNYDSLEAAEKAGAAVMRHGKFIMTIVDFTIIAFVIFLIVKWISNLKKKEEAAPAAPPKNEVLLGEIRDLLRR